QGSTGRRARASFFGRSSIRGGGAGVARVLLPSEVRLRTREGRCQTPLVLHDFRVGGCGRKGGGPTSLPPAGCVSGGGRYGDAQHDDPSVLCGRVTEREGSRAGRSGFPDGG